jgi:hypothetical protein
MQQRCFALCNLQVLLLEAYEQLEADVGQEVDRALARQAEEIARLSRRVQFFEGHLETEKKQVEVLSEEMARLEGQLGEANTRMAQYESGVYGLPQVGLRTCSRLCSRPCAAPLAHVAESGSPCPPTGHWRST